MLAIMRRAERALFFYKRMKLSSSGPHGHVGFQQPLLYLADVKHMKMMYCVPIKCGEPRQ
jgi:hypothetical protein